MTESRVDPPAVRAPEVGGRRYPRSEIVPVTRSAIREFAEAIGDPDPSCRDLSAARARGHPDLIAPPTFLATMLGRIAAPVLCDPDIDIDPVSVLHRDQRFEFTRPVFAGDQLIATASVVRFTAVDDIRVLTIRCVVTDEGGATVCVMTTTLAGSRRREAAPGQAAQDDAARRSISAR